MDTLLKASEVLVTNTYIPTSCPLTVIERLDALKPSQILSIIEPAIISNRKLPNFELDVQTFGDTVIRENTSHYLGCVATCVISWVAGITVPAMLGEEQYTSLIYAVSNNPQLDSWYVKLDDVRFGYIYTLLTRSNLKGAPKTTWDLEARFVSTRRDFLLENFTILNDIIKDLQTLGA